MAKVVLINPPQAFSGTMTAAGVIPPLGLLYLAAYLRKFGYEVKIIDSVVESISEINDFEDNVKIRGLDIGSIVKKAKEENPALIGISNLFSFAHPVAERLAKELKENIPGVKIVFGGAHPSALPEEVLKNKNIDFVVISEGENTLLELVRELEGANDFQKLDGLGFKDGERIVVNPKTKFIEDLDSVPFPARDLVPLEKYYEAKESHGMTEGRWTTIISSRGCPYDCTFCTPQLWGRRYRVRSAANVLAEIRECFEKYGIKEYHFEDENLTIDKKRIIEICEGIKRISGEIKWQAPNGIRASVTDAEILRAMKESGCEHITVAPESGSPRVLNEIIRKRQNLSQVTEVVKEAHKIGLKTLAYFIVGLPGETKEDVLLTIRYVKELAKAGLDEVGFSNYIPLPGSELYNKLKSENRLNIENWFDLLSIADITKSNSWCENISSEELSRFRQRGYLIFHFTKLLYRPQDVMKSVFNIMIGRQKLKTERVVITMIKRRIKKIFS
jgi:anaerobic magnesium-protoporphyrin IX monomethyl ester cyclase